MAHDTDVIDANHILGAFNKGHMQGHEMGMSQYLGDTA